MTAQSDHAGGLIWPDLLGLPDFHGASVIRPQVKTSAARRPGAPSSWVPLPAPIFSCSSCRSCRVWLCLERMPVFSLAFPFQSLLASPGRGPCCSFEGFPPLIGRAKKTANDCGSGGSCFAGGSCRGKHLAEARSGWDNGLRLLGFRARGRWPQHSLGAGAMVPRDTAVSRSV